MSRRYTIKGIAGDDTYNALVLYLNTSPYVSDLTTSRAAVSFTVDEIGYIRPDLDAISTDMIIEDVSTHPQESESVYRFMVEADDEATAEFLTRLKALDQYKEIEYDAFNHLLVVKSSAEDVPAQLAQLLAEVSPKATITLHRQPRVDQHAFRKAMISRFLPIGIFALSLALALVLDAKNSPLALVFFTVCVLTLSLRIVRRAFAGLTEGRVLWEDVIILLGLVLGALSGHPWTTMIASLFIQGSEEIRAMMMTRAMSKVDKVANAHAHVMIKTEAGTTDVLLSEVHIGDEMVIEHGEAVSLSGVLMSPSATLSSYMRDSDTTLKTLSSGAYIDSGYVNMGDAFSLRVSETSDESALGDVFTSLDRFDLSAAAVSRTTIRLSRLFTMVVVLTAIALVVMHALTQPDDIQEWLHVGALLLLASGGFASVQASACAMLAAMARAGHERIVIPNLNAFDALNDARILVYDRTHQEKMDEEERHQVTELARLGRAVVVISDTQEEDISDMKVMGSLSVEDKRAAIDKQMGDVALLCDYETDESLLELSKVNVSRGGLVEGRERPDTIVCADARVHVSRAFRIAGRMRDLCTLNLILSFFVKVFLLMMIGLWHDTCLFLVPVCDLLIAAVTLTIALLPLRGVKAGA